MDIAKMLKRKESIVTKMSKGIEFLFRKNKITWLKGHGKFAGRNETGFLVAVDGDEPDTVVAKNVIIATGSKARHLPGLNVDNKIVCDNEGALAFDSVPAKLGVIGAGVIGLELGSVWRRLGSDVTVLEALPTFLGACDDSVSKEAFKLFTEQGLKINLGVKIGDIKVTAKGVKVAYADSDGKSKTLDVDRLIVSIGRIPNTDSLQLEQVGLAVDERGFIPVDDHCATSVPGVYAVGDVVRGPMLAHKGEDEGVMVAETIAGQKPHIDYDCIPWVIYTSPEIAWVGRTEQQLKAEGRAYKSGQFPFAANGRAFGHGLARGFCESFGRRRNRRDSRRSHHWCGGIRHDRGGSRGDGI